MLDTRLDPTDAPALPPRRAGFPTGMLAFVLVVIAVAIAAGGYFWKLRHDVPAQPAAPPAVASAPPSVAPQPDLAPHIEHPIEALAPAAPSAALPPLGESDAALADALRALLPGSMLDLFQPDRIARRIVATVDNLPRQTLSPDVRPFRPVPGAFVVSTSDGSHAIAPDNAARYTRYVDALVAVDSRQLVATYARFHPLLQEAYRELGYPSGYFNDRLVVVIDDLLAAPTPSSPVEVVQPKVLYQYADPALDALSAGQKIMVRMGPDNARRVKAKLVEIRGLIATTPRR